MLKDKKTVYRIVAGIWAGVFILAVVGGTYRIALVTLILAVVFFLLPNWIDTGSPGNSGSEDKD